MDDRLLVRAALSARERAYAPYSRFKVGVALLCQNGRVYTGCNVENASYGAANCAERTAVFKAVSEGERGFAAIAVAGGEQDKPLGFAYPCGICRQVMREFCDPESFRVIVASSEDDRESYTLNQLLPHGFGPENLR